MGILFLLKNSLSIETKPCIDLTQILTLISCYHNATFILLRFNYLYVLIVMFSFVFRLGKISSAVIITTELLISHKNFSKFCQFPYVNYIQSAGFHFGRGGRCRRKHKNWGEKKQKRMKLFQEQDVFPPYQSWVGGPSYAPFGKGVSLRDTLASASPVRHASKNGGVRFLKDGLYVDISAVYIKHFYINKFSTFFKHKLATFIIRTGLSEPKPFSLNYFDFLILVFILIYKHGFK